MTLFASSAMTYVSPLPALASPPPAFILVQSSLIYNN